MILPPGLLPTSAIRAGAKLPLGGGNGRNWRDMVGDATVLTDTSVYIVPQHNTNFLQIYYNKTNIYIFIYKIVISYIWWNEIYRCMNFMGAI